MKKKWTRDEIARTYAKAFRVSRRDAEEAVDAVQDCIQSGGTRLIKWMEILVAWGWFYNATTKDAAKTCARLMRAFGIKTPLKYICAECGCKAEVKV